MTATTSDVIDPADLAGRSGARLLDVRTPAEFETIRIPGSVNLPLAELGPHAARLGGLAGRPAPLVLVCQSGVRAHQAARTLRAAGAEVQVLSGGVDAWSAAGQRVERGRARWAMERQVRLVAGSVVLTSVLAGVRFPRASAAAGLIGGGLTFSALSNTCTMATLLAKLPYNRPGGVDAEAAVRALS